MNATAEHRQIDIGHLIRAFLMLFGYGILWGWLWFSAAMAIPFFYVVAQGVDIAVYGFMGTRLRGNLEGLAVSARARGAFGLLGVLIFYLGNRLISLTLIIGTSSFTENNSWQAAMLFESLVLLAGLVTALGLWKPAPNHHSHGEDTPTAQ